MADKVVLAFSGGLDTSWCVPWLLEQGHEVVTATVDVGGISAEEAEALRIQSQTLGATQHVHVDAREMYFEEVVRYLLAGNVMRGGIYPLCVGSERALQARESARVAQEVGATAVAHGCTAAGNDQVRFDIALRAYAPDIKAIAPIRDLAPSRPDQVAYLQERGLPVPAFGADYSVNSGLWGVTIGGKETKTTDQTIPEDAWQRTRGAFARPVPEERVTISFYRGRPDGLDGIKGDSVEAIEKIDAVAARHGIGRGIHLGETVLGVKGRVAFEAPAATLLIAAHRELEKLVMTSRQIMAKDQMAALYGEYVHTGQFPDPVCRDIEAFLASSQERVTGKVHVVLRSGSFMVEGVESPYSLHSASRAVYGEAVGEWEPRDAQGFSTIVGLPSVLHARAGRQH